MSCALPCTWWCCTIEPAWAPPRKLQTKSLSYVCSGLFCKPILVLFLLWYSSCFEVKCWFHTFPKWCSHISMWILILHDNRDCHVNSFQPACLSSSGSIHFNIHKINSKSSQRYLFHPSQVVFVFPVLPPFFFKDSDFLIKYPFIDGKSPHSFPSIF